LFYTVEIALLGTILPNEKDINTNK